MNVSTLVVTQEEAAMKLQQYKSLADRRRVAEDDKLESLYQAVSKGARVLSLISAFQQTGLNDKGQPKLAIARSDWKDVRFESEQTWARHGGRFSLPNSRSKAQQISLPIGTFAGAKGNLTSPVPFVPADVRPKLKLYNYWTLFEVKEWKSYPVDPFLLRRISGMLFVVEAEWELTDLEAGLLSAMRTGN